MTRRRSETPDPAKDGLHSVTSTRSVGAQIQVGVAVWTTVLATLIVASSVLFALSTDPGRSRLGVCGTAIAVFTAAASIGAGLGLVFGLPRSVAQESPTPPTKRSRARYVPNTNLLKVSDWLTTILIGLGLVQLGRVGEAVSGLADALEKPLGDSDSSGAFGAATCIAASVSAFVVCYLWTVLGARELLEAGESQWNDVNEEDPKPGDQPSVPQLARDDDASEPEKEAENMSPS
jgi:hypothetical protein